MVPCRSSGDGEWGMRRVRDETEVVRRSRARGEPRSRAMSPPPRAKRGTEVEDRKARTLTFEASMLCVRSLMVSASLVS